MYRDASIEGNRRASFDLLRCGNYDWGMIAMMAVQDDWIPVEKAADVAGCSPQYIRRLLDQNLDETTGRTKGGRLDGWRVTGKSWMVLKSSAIALRETLSTRARIHEAKRAVKKVAKKAAKRKK